MGSQKQSVVEVSKFQSSIPDNYLRKLKTQGSGIVLSGTGSTSHYPAFWRNKIIIPVHSFVFVKAEGGGHYVGYLMDLYADIKGNKRADVRRFRHNRELKGEIPDLKYDPREIFMTPLVQAISVDCIDGFAAVLTPTHYEKCLDVVSLTVSTHVHVCTRKIVNFKVKSFYVDALHGYTCQPILSCIDWPHSLETPLYNPQVKNLNPRKQLMKREPPVKRMKINSKNGGDTSFDLVKSETTTPSHVLFKVGETIEVLSQDSGTSGCWFRCKVSKASPKFFRVQYVDILDADDFTNLQEHISAFQSAAPDKLGMRCSGRPKIRPYPPPKDDYSFVAENKNHYEIGCAVDAWWCDGWWEGFVIGQKSQTEETLQVYIPGENLTLAVEAKDLRISRDWIGGKWVDIKRANKDTLTRISSSAAKPKTVRNKPEEKVDNNLMKPLRIGNRE